MMSITKDKQLFTLIQNLKLYEQINFSIENRPDDHSLIYTVVNLGPYLDFYDANYVESLHLNEIEKKINKLDYNYYWFGALDDKSEDYPTHKIN